VGLSLPAPGISRSMTNLGMGVFRWVVTTLGASWEQCPV
jgi:hypothetical protein